MKTNYSTKPRTRKDWAVFVLVMVAMLVGLMATIIGLHVIVKGVLCFS